MVARSFEIHLLLRDLRSLIHCTRYRRQSRGRLRSGAMSAIHCPRYILYSNLRCLQARGPEETLTVDLRFAA
jgi:hypothetical protein